MISKTEIGKAMGKLATYAKRVDFLMNAISTSNSIHGSKSTGTAIKIPIGVDTVELLRG